MDFRKIIVIGMARSGTTLVTNTLGGLNDVKVAVEPHALWKSGNFSYLNDEQFDIKESNVSYIRRKLLEYSKGYHLVEKSPINCIRPSLVSKVFPDAKIIYIERDPVRCIYSNYQRSLTNDSYKPSIVLKKYFGRAGSPDLPNARSDMSLFEQIRYSDIPFFTWNIAHMLYLRNFEMKHFPFGTKLKEFRRIVDEVGLIGYHVEVFKRAHDLKQEFKYFFDDIYFTSMEEITTSKSAMKDLLNFTDLSFKQSQLDDLFDQLDKSRVKESGKSSSVDREIEKLL